MSAAYAIEPVDVFAEADRQFAQMKTRLGSRETSRMEHGEVERLLQREGYELLRLLFQGHLDLRAHDERERGLSRAVVGAEGVERTHHRSPTRGLKTLFGQVEIERIAYGARGHGSLMPLDAALNLPPTLPSHGLRERVAVEASKGSFDEAVASIQATTGTTLAKRQVEEATVAAAADFDAFYASRSGPAGLTGPVLVVSVDGKGVVMHREDLRPSTRKAAEASSPKLSRRRSKGEKPHRKRMATVAAVHTIDRFERTADEIVGELDRTDTAPQDRPRPEHKRVWASVEKDAGEVIAEALAEARERDPGHLKDWVALVDGNAAQIERLEAGAAREGVELTIILDLIHVAEYLWKAAWSLFAEGDPAAQGWVTERLRRILQGRASAVAGGIRRSATKRGLSQHRREAVDRCADYLLNHRAYLAYDRYLAAGYPIATGVIEGACRHLVKDRMDRTGARWRLPGAEAVLRLRSIRSSGDWDEYWRFHLAQERSRNHEQRYRRGHVPRVRGRSPKSKTPRANLRVVK